MLDPSRFTRSGGLGAGIADQVADDKVLAEFAAGATLVLQGLHRTWPPLVDFAQQLSGDLGHPVQVNAYVTPASNRGLRPALRRARRPRPAGRRRRSAGPSTRPVHEHPLADQPWTDHREAVAARAEQPPVIDTVLRPGDALYLPRGWLHSAEALGETTIHLTVGMHATTRYDVLQALVALAADSPELRASLPLGVDPDDPATLAADLEATVKALTERLGAATAAGRGRRRTPPDRRAPRGPSRSAPLAQSRAAEHGRGRHRRPAAPARPPAARPTCRWPGPGCATTTRTAAPFRSACRPALRGPSRRWRRSPSASSPVWTSPTRARLVARLLREAVVVPG